MAASTTVNLLLFLLGSYLLVSLSSGHLEVVNVKDHVSYCIGMSSEACFNHISFYDPDIKLGKRMTFEPSPGKFDINRVVLVVNMDDVVIRALTARHVCSETSPGNAGFAKVQKISQAMRIYLERSQAHNTMMKEEVDEFEKGRRYLATMMGLSPDQITQEDIDTAIEYLLPSGLFDKKARPKFKHPLEVLPKRKAAQFGLDGRPFNCFFYTSKQNYAQMLHTISCKMDELKRLDDSNAGGRHVSEDFVQLKGSEWLSLEKVDQLIEERLLVPEYKTLISSLEHLSHLPHSSLQHQFIMSFRLDLKQQSSFSLFQKQPPLQDEKGRKYHEDTGKRKKGRAVVRLFQGGSGQVVVNQKSFIEHFPRLADREQLLFPLHLMGLLGKVDVEVEVEGGGPSGQAGASRLALSKCLQHVVSEEERMKLKIAGLLTSDPRTLERQKPGKSGARRGYTWKKR